MPAESGPSAATQLLPNYGGIVMRAKAYYLTVAVFLGKVLEALRDLFRATATLHLELCMKSMPGGCVDQSGAQFQ